MQHGVWALAGSVIFVGACFPVFGVDWEAGPSVADPAFVAQPIWEDGRAEVAMYRATRGAGKEAQTLDLGTFVVRHPFDPRSQSKAESRPGVDSFKWATFFEYEVGSEQFKINYVVNQVKSNLRPLKVSMTRFDWCSNQYREVAYAEDGKVRHLMRSDDYGNVDELRRAEDGYSFVQLWWLVRAVDLSKGPVVVHLQGFDGASHRARFALTGTSTRSVGGQVVVTEDVEVRHAAPSITLLGPRKIKVERFVRAKERSRELISAEGADYRLELIEVVRSPYWQEDVWKRFTRTQRRP